MAKKTDLVKTHTSLDPDLRRWLTQRARASKWRRSALIRHLLQTSRGRLAAAGAPLDGPDLSIGSSLTATLSADVDLGDPDPRPEEMTLTLAGRSYRLVPVDGPTEGELDGGRERTEPLDVD